MRQTAESRHALSGQPLPSLTARLPFHHAGPKGGTHPPEPIGLPMPMTEKAPEETAAELMLAVCCGSVVAARWSLAERPVLTAKQPSPFGRIGGEGRPTGRDRSSRAAVPPVEPNFGD
jgi:hypothetical protein